MSRSQFKELPKSDIENYRQIEVLSYSALKMYEDDRKLYKSIFIDKDEEIIRKDKEKKNKSDDIRIGNIVDVILTDNENFHNYFVETVAPKPSGQMLTLVNFLRDFTVADTVEGVVQTTFEERFVRAYEALKESNGGKLQSKLETFTEKFKTDGEPYFKELLNCIGRTAITTEEKVLGEAIVENMKFAEGTRNIVNAEGLTKYPILFTVGDTPMKMEADKIIFDHENKIIKPYDIKITNFVESFIWDGFLNKRYYIQAALYKFGIEQWKEDTEFKDYRVENMGFVVGDQNNYYSPLLYETTDEHYEQGWLGFKVGNKMYKGIGQIMDNLKQSIETNNWGMSAENIRNKGKVYIPLFKNLEE